MSIEKHEGSTTLAHSFSGVAESACGLEGTCRIFAAGSQASRLVQSI